MDLLALLEETQVDEAAAIAKAEQVLKTENEVKKRQMALLIRIKNVLTKDQQNRLRALRDRGGNGAGGAPGSGSQEEERS
jgi:Spy/CpxP family protein refolding chaperone